MADAPDWEVAPTECMSVLMSVCPLGSCAAPEYTIMC